jgi:hypothetical protein
MYSPREVRELGDEIERHVRVPAETHKAMPRPQLGELVKEVDALFQRIKAVSASMESHRAAYVTEYGEEDTRALAGYVAYELRRADYCLSFLQFIHHMKD